MTSFKEQLLYEYVPPQAIAEALGSDIFDVTVPMAEAVVVPPATATPTADPPGELKVAAAARNGSADHDLPPSLPAKKAKKRPAGTGANTEPLSLPAWKKNSRLPDQSWYS